VPTGKGAIYIIAQGEGGDSAPNRTKGRKNAHSTWGSSCKGKAALLGDSLLGGHRGYRRGEIYGSSGTTSTM